MIRIVRTITYVIKYSKILMQTVLFLFDHPGEDITLKYLPQYLKSISRLRNIDIKWFIISELTKHFCSF